MLQKLLIILLALALIAPAPLWAANVVDDQIQVKEHDLEGLRRELAQKRAEKDKLDGREKGVLSEINGLEQRIDLAEKLVRQLKNKKAGCQKEVKSLTSKLSATEERAAARRQVLAERARQLYMHGRLGELEAFLSAASLPELARKVHNYRHLADQDRQLIQQALADQRTIAADKVKLENQIEQTARLESEKLREEKNLKGEKSGRSKLLREIRDQKAAYEQAIRDLEESARQIQMIIEHLERQRDETSPAVPE
ncbi:murein hydrolase activator EnvC family protein, partial [Candidatus Zixiibacteriota bacterium]